MSADFFTALATLPKDKRRLVLTELGQREFTRCADDIFYWLDASKHMKTAKHPEGLPYVYTMDPHPMHKCLHCGEVVTAYKRDVHLEILHELKPPKDSEYPQHFSIQDPVRPFTLHPYMPPIITTWLKEPLVAIEKSRDMMATWLVVTMYTWDTLFHTGRQNIFQSEDGAKTCELVDRANFIYTHQPPFLQHIHKANYSKGPSKSGELKVPTLHSEILGFPQGPDQIRQYHPSGIFMDEAAYQIEAENAFAAIKPSIQNGGRCTLVSSANPSFFWRICTDESS